MKIYVGAGAKRQEKFEAGFLEFANFESMVRESTTPEKSDFGWINIQNISGWYKDKIDEELVGYVATGNSEKLNEYIETHKQGTEKAKEYLRNLRFDGDGIATKGYLDTSGWSLLNVAAAKGQPEMVDFLVQHVGMDVNTICYGVCPMYCCFPSMHDGMDNFSSARMEAAKAFAANGADISHTITYSREGYKPSGLNMLHTACNIKDSTLLHEALSFLTERMTDCNIVDTDGKNALHHLFRSSGDKYSTIVPSVERLLRMKVLPTQRTRNGALPADFLSNHADKHSFQELVRNNSIIFGR